MTREEAKQNLIALGIEEPTDAQVTNYLNQFHSNRPAPAPNPNPAPKPEPQPQPTPAPVPNPQPNPNPSPQNDDEIEKLRKQIDSLQKENIKKDIRAYAAEKGLTGEQADTVLAGFQDNLEIAKAAIDSLSQIIAEKETKAAQAKEQEIADDSINPGGNAGRKKDEEKPEDVANAEQIVFAVSTYYFSSYSIHKIHLPISFIGTL